MKHLNHISASAILFIALWAWAWGWWGDVLWVAHERSFFAFENELVQHVWSKSFGSLWLIGRALLTLCAWPWLGSLLLAAILTATTSCLTYVARPYIMRDTASKSLSVTLSALCALPSLAWVFYLTYSSFDAYFKSEPGRIFGIPVLVLLIVAAQAFFLYTFRRRRARTAPTASERISAATQVITLAALLMATCFFETKCRPWTRPTAAMERAYAAEDWTSIRKTATDNATLSCRPMAAYYAIALVRQHAIMKNLFDIRFEYDEIFMHDWSGESMNSTLYYVSECDMHAGLLQFAYHKAIEDMTVDGPTNHNLKILTQITAMRHENTLCRKYLAILERTPGNADFTRRWRTYISDNKKMEADATVKGIRDIEPMHDAFESSYTDPAFLGYNLQLYEGRTQQALINSIAVCLYTKLVPPFLERAQYMSADGIMQNPIIADALAMQASKNPDILNALPQLKYNQQRYLGFIKKMQAAHATGETAQRMPYAEQLFTPSYYPYYYFFGNLRATRSDAAAKYGYGQKDGVN